MRDNIVYGVCEDGLHCPTGGDYLMTRQLRVSISSTMKFKGIIEETRNVCYEKILTVKVAKLCQNY